MNFDQRPLAEAFVENAAQSSARRVAHRLVVAAQARRQFVEGAFDGAAQGGSRGFGGSRFDYANRADRRRRQGLAALCAASSTNASASGQWSKFIWSGFRLQ